MAAHVLCPVDDLEPGTAKRFEVGSTAIALVRIDDDFYAIGDRCSHANVSLSEGFVLCEERMLECWRHGSPFSLETGEPQLLPATKPVPVFAVTVVDGNVVVEVD